MVGPVIVRSTSSAPVSMNMRHEACPIVRLELTLASMADMVRELARITCRNSSR